ncbi:hypothetical protein GCM10022402_33430 [Salinactinospora qingdaonensis]|uniref:Secreted protein n=1 Tax=Salinactinospora qingdaonensis TaxID=702744 RepID=A0ABP7G4L6_9ACTN
MVPLFNALVGAFMWRKCCFILRATPHASGETLDMYKVNVACQGSWKFGVGGWGTDPGASNRGGRMCGLTTRPLLVQAFMSQASL